MFVNVTVENGSHELLEPTPIPSLLWDWICLIFWCRVEDVDGGLWCSKISEILGLGGK